MEHGTNIHFPAALSFLAFTCLASQLGSLLDKLPFPKNPLVHRILESLAFVTHTERVAGSKTPSQCGFRTSSLEPPRPRLPSSEEKELVLVGSGEVKRRGRGWA